MENKSYKGINKSKVEKVMKEYKDKKLKSSAGSKIRNRRQAVAIALSEARKAK